uniref:Na+ driven multidrug efflux pump n=1 Tax=uncultured bacterium contig00117 TaxID=1181578 RepID=A0A806KB90_9BACT|nr:Na+ driven multidrug efflux pump [uncultured bacterium contig00117]
MAVKDKSLFSLSWPLVVTFGIGMALPMLDSWFLSRRSVEAAAGVGALMPVIGTLFMAIHAFAQAGASIASQFLGGDRPRHAQVTQTLVIAGSAVIGIAMGIFLWFTTPLIVSLMGLAGEPAEAATKFLYAISPAIVFRALQGTLTSLIATHGRTIWNLLSTILMLVVNCVLNYIFLEGYFGVPVFMQGVYGVAIATGISWVVSMIMLWIVLVYSLEHKTKLTDIKKGYYVLLPEWLRIGIPAAVEPVSFQLFQVFVIALFVRLGDVSIAARVFAGAFAMCAVVFSVGLGSGSQILVAHLVGNKEFDKADKRLHQSLIWSCSSALAIAVLVALAGQILLRFYTDVPDILALGGLLLWCDVVLQPFKAANIVITNALRASGDSAFPAVYGTISMWTLGLGTTLFLCFGIELGAIGLWLGMASDEFYRSIVNYIRWRRGKWKSKGVIR